MIISKETMFEAKKPCIPSDQPWFLHAIHLRSTQGIRQFANKVLCVEGVAEPAILSSWQYMNEN